MQSRVEWWNRKDNFNEFYSQTVQGQNLLAFFCGFMFFILSNLKVCLRSGSLKLLLYLGISSVLLAIMVSAFAGRQPQTLLVDFAFSTIRVSLAIAALLWVQDLFCKPLEMKTVVQYLSYPASRLRYLLTVFCSIALVLFLAVACFALITYLASLIVAGSQQSTPIDFGLSYLLMWLFLYLDVMILVSFSFAIASVSTTPFLPIIVGVGFYIAGHSLQQMIDLLSIAEYIDGREFFQTVLDFLRYIVPDLSVFDVRHWSIYSESIDYQYLITKFFSGLLYLVLCLSLAIHQFGRREIV